MADINTSTAEPVIVHLVSADVTIAAGTTRLGHLTELADGVVITIEDGAVWLEL